MDTAVSTNKLIAIRQFVHFTVILLHPNTAFFETRAV